MIEITRRIIQGRERLPDRRGNERFEFDYGGSRYTATVGRFDDGRPSEIFLDCHKPGSELAIFANDCAVLASLLLQYGVDCKTISHSISGPIATALAKIGGAK